MQIFASHISEEAHVALVLKEWIESTFLGQVAVFVSSDPADIPAGTNWLGQLDSALQRSNLLLSLYSQASVGRPWITFEAGCAWIRKIPIIPICHSGLGVGDLPQPLSSFQALDLHDPRFGEKLFAALAKHGNFSKLPKIEYAKFQGELAAALGRAATATVKETPRTDASRAAGTETYTKTQISILRELAKAKDSGFQNTVEFVLAQRVGVRPTLFGHEVKRLVDNNYVRNHLRVGGPVAYSISDAGVAYLVREHLLGDDAP